MMSTGYDDCPHCGFDKAFRYDEFGVETNLECPRCGYFYFGNADAAGQGSMTLSSVNRRRGGEGLPLYREADYAAARAEYADGPWMEDVPTVPGAEYSEEDGAWVSIPTEPLPPHTVQ